MLRFQISLAFLFIALPAMSSAEQPPSDDLAALHRQQFDAHVRPFLVKHCSGCHGEATQKAELNLMALDPDMAAGDDTALWNEVLDQLVARRMPPKEKPRPEADELTSMIRWLTAELERAARVRRSTDGRVVVRRMNRRQYSYALQDLLGVELDFTGDLPPEAISVDGFNNNGAQISVSSLHIENYLAIARKALDKTLVNGEMPEVSHYRFSFDRTPFVEPDGDRKSKLTATFYDTTPDGNQPIPLTAIMAVDEKTRQISGFVSYKNKDRQSSGRDGSFATLSGNELKATADAIVLPPNHSGRASVTFQMDEFPRQGKYRLRIKAASMPPTGREKLGDHRPARLRIRIGGRRGNSSGAEVPIADIDVEAPVAGPREYVFEDYFENQNVPLRNILYAKHIRVVVENPAPKPPKNKDGKREFPPDEPAYSSLLVYELEFEAPLIKSWPPPHHTAVMGTANNETDERAYEIIRRFVSRAFRRPDDPRDAERFIAVYQQSRKLEYSFDESIKHALTAVLCAPEFLFLAESDAAAKNENPRRVNAYELASRLSMFLWSSIPDEELLAAAQSEKLLDPKVLTAQVDRMLGDPKSKRSLRDFVDQWLELSKLDNININNRILPDQPPTLKADMLEESRRFYEQLVLGDAPCRDLIASDYSYLNETLADHYGVSGVLGREFRKVRWPQSGQRGGLLGHASVMTLSADGTRTLPILRGAWFLRTVMNDPPPPPPDVVPELDTRTQDSDELTLKEKLARHRNDAACLDCHRKIDPWGFPFEQYDAIGRWRTTMPNSKDGKVDSTAIFSDGTKIAGMAELREHMLQEKYDAFLKAYIEKLLAYALGRSLEYTDRAEVNDLVQTVKQNGATMRGVYRAIVLSDAFRMK